MTVILMFCRSGRRLHSERPVWNYHTYFAHSRQLCVFSLQRKRYGHSRHSVQLQSVLIFIFLRPRNNG